MKSTEGKIPRIAENRVTTSELFKFFQNAAGHYAEHDAIETSRGTLTFSELFREAEEFALQLQKTGVSEGQVIVVCLDNSREFVPLVLSLWKLSCKVALVSPKYGKSELSAIMRGISPDGILLQKELTLNTESEFADFQTAEISLPDNRGKIKLTTQRNRKISGNSVDDSSGKGLIRSAETVLLKFTSGSTGEPKGIALSGRNLIEEATNIVTTLKITADDQILAPVPLTHSYGFDLGVLPMLITGCTLMIREMFIPRMTAADLAEMKTTIFLGVPSMYRFLVETPFAKIPDWRHVRYLLSCTAPLSGELIREFAQKFGCMICQHYGSSETGAVANHIPSEVMRRSTSVGKPIHGVEISVRDENGNGVGIDHEGEIEVKSSAVARGYIMGQEMKDDRLRDGVYRTGDIGMIDGDGFLQILGRLDGVINVGGFKVWPGEIEAVLESHPAVREAVVIGIDEESGGMVVGAAVTVRQEVSEKEILKFCREKLADYKAPRLLRIFGQLPLGPTGKVKLTAKDLKT